MFEQNNRSLGASTSPWSITTPSWSGWAESGVPLSTISLDHYIDGVEGFLEVLEARGGDRFLERIALISGELYVTEEIAPDGRNIRISPDGRYAAYETTTDGATLTHLARVDGTGDPIDIDGTGLVFGPYGRYAFLAVPETSALLAARNELEAVDPGDAQAVREAQQRVVKFAYVGNVHDRERESTYCPNCDKVVIERDWYELGEYNLDGDRCKFCGTVIPGVFEKGPHAPGHWGRKRVPIRIRDTARQYTSISTSALGAGLKDPDQREYGECDAAATKSVKRHATPAVAT